MNALNNSLSNMPASVGSLEHPVLQAMKRWPAVGELGGDEIIAAAVLEGDTIFWCARPSSHYHIVTAKWRNDEAGFSDDSVQGFLTRNGRFLDRFEAHALAVKSGITPGNSSKLDTSDLW